MRASAVAALLLVAALLAAGCTASEPPAAPADECEGRVASAPTGPVPNAGQVMLRWPDIHVNENAHAGGWLVIHAWQACLIPGLKAANPDLRVLMYKNAAAVQQEEHPGTGRYATGLSYDEAVEGGWLVRNPPGTTGLLQSPVQRWSDFPDLFAVDLGEGDYQERWADAVLAELEADQERWGDDTAAAVEGWDPGTDRVWDGVMVDDVMSTLSHPVVGRCTEAADECRGSVEIPDSEAQYAATESFLAGVAPRLRGSDYLVVPNVGVEWHNWESTLADWTGYVDGWEHEFFVKWDHRTGPRFQTSEWRWKLDLVQWAMDRGTPILPVTYSDGTDTVAQEYHRATFLLAWNGTDGASAFVPYPVTEEGDDHWLLPAVADVGTPLGPPEGIDGNRFWMRRDYSVGAVVVNATRRTRTLDLGAPYLRGDRWLTELTLEPATGAVLASGPA